MSTRGKGPTKVTPAPAWSTRSTNVAGKGPVKGASPVKGAGTVTPSHVKPVLDNRDPRNINIHVKTHFEDVIGERGVQSPDCIWRCSYSCYTCWKNCLYKLSSLFCGVCLAIYYGCTFPVLAFPCIWFGTPLAVCFRMLSIQCGKIFKHCCACAIGSWTEACGAVFWAFNPKYTRASLLPTSRQNVKFKDNVSTKVIPRNRNLPDPKSAPRKLIQNKGVPSSKNINPTKKR